MSAITRLGLPCLCLVFGSVAAAQQSTDAPSAPPPRAWSAGPIQFSGLVDGYYSLSFNHPASHTNVIRNFDVRAGSLSLNMAKLVLEHAPEPVGFRMDIGFGRAFDLFHSTEPLQDGSSIMRHLMQAYMSVKPKGGGGFQFDFGKFVTSAGAEPTETHLNWHYSRALLYANGPYYHFGARVTRPVTSFWTAGVQVLNGWNNVEDNNSGKTFGFTSALTGRKVGLLNTYYVGPEKRGTNEGYRHFIDTVVTLTPSERANFYVNYDYGVDKAIRGQGPDQNWWGIGLAGHFAASPRFSFSPRYEYYNDVRGFITGQPQKLQEFTLTAEMKMQDGFLTRVEYRRDWSNQPFFDRGNEPASARRQNTLLVGFVVYFGPK